MKLFHIGGSSFTHDDNGNLLSDGGSSYSWNAKNLLVEANAVHYQYDAFLRRIKKENDDGTTERFVIDGWSTIAEISSVGTQKKLIYGDYIDELICMITDDDTFMVASNHQYSIVNLYNSSGANVKGYDYTPFGKMRIFSPSGSEINSSAVGNTRGYTGREWDIETGIYYYRARYYDPGMGRLLSEDPIEFYGDDLNVYRYVWNSPTNWFDPYGLKGEDKNGKKGEDKTKGPAFVKKQLQDGLLSKDPGLSKNFRLAQ